MPRQARIDAPGSLHHIICRGLERKAIFCDDADRDNFVARLANILTRTATPCFAWTLIPNHFHLLLQTGTVPIATVMERLLTGHACYFNRRHHRQGHLFQNRYKSILCQREAYLLDLVRYIHLNPVRAGIARSVEALKDYPYCGHSELMGVRKGIANPQTIEEVLGRFGSDIELARQKYETFVVEGIAAGKRPDLIGGGLLRSAGGWQNVMCARRYGEHLKSDERILGDSEFVEEVLGTAEEHLERICSYLQKGLDLDGLAKVVAGLLGIDISQVWRGGKKSITVQARSLLCYWAVRELGMTATAVARRLSLTQPGVAGAVNRGENLVTKNGWCLTQLISQIESKAV